MMTYSTYSTVQYSTLTRSLKHSHLVLKKWPMTIELTDAHHKGVQTNIYCRMGTHEACVFRCPKAA